MSKVSKESRQPLASRISQLSAATGIQRPALKTPCALQIVSCGLCQGKGFSKSAKGAQVAARLCDCVTSCPSCFGKMRRFDGQFSRRCREPSPDRIVNHLNDAAIPARYLDASFDKFRNFTGNGREVCSSFEKWLKAFHPHGKGILLGGAVGVGKTYLLAAVTMRLLLQGWSVRFVDFFQLLSVLRAAYANEQSDDQVLKPLIDCDVLVIDELGKGRNSDWEITILDHLVMGRYNQSKTIVASTNYQLKVPAHKTSPSYFDFGETGEPNRAGGFLADKFESLEARVGKRIFSRLCEISEFMELTGEDFRRIG